MKLIKEALNGVLVIKLTKFKDKRGYFTEAYNQEKFDKLFKKKVKLVQDNISLSRSGTIRGLHYQTKPFEQGKLVTVLKGKIFDVAVDLRKKSKTYGKYVSVIISDKSDFSFYIPKGFAHGFLCLSKKCTVNYKCSNYRDQKSEKTLLWNDNLLKIKWPTKKPILSEKDKNGLSLSNFK